MTAPLSPAALQESAGGWAAVRLSGPSALVAELVAVLSQGLDMAQPMPAPLDGQEEARWYGMVRPAGNAPAKPPTPSKRRAAQDGGPVLMAGVDGPLLMVRGRTRASLEEAAAAYAAAHELVLLDPPGTVASERIRPVRYCLPHCGCGRDVAHYIPAAAGAPGSFPGAFFAVCPSGDVAEAS